MSEQPITITAQGEIEIVALNRPERLNAMDEPLIAALLDLLPPFLFKEIFDVGIKKGDSGLVTRIAVLMVLAALAGAFLAIVQRYFSAKADLFTPARCRSAVIMVDDAWGRRLAASDRPDPWPVSGS